MTARKTKLSIGTVYQNEKGGTYYYRYQVNGQRKAVSLKTKNLKEAVSKAQEMEPLLKASSVEVVAAHVSQARSMVQAERRLELAKAWNVYNSHPDRARPANVDTCLNYEVYFSNFVNWATARGHVFLDEITDPIAAEYVETLRTEQISVDTHNKRVARIARVFHTLKDYTRPDTSDWRNRHFRRKAREEIGLGARRLPFTKEQEERLLAALEEPANDIPDLQEMRVLFYLGALTGQRLKDCALLQWHNVSLPRQRLTVTQFKTGKEVAIPIAPKLLEILHEATRWKQDNYVLPNIAKRYAAKDSRNRPVGPGRINYYIMKIIRQSGLEPQAKVQGRRKAVTVYGFHSLRHSFVSFCIEHNIPKAVAVSILGADSDIIDQYYTHVGEEAQEQAIQLISGNGMSMKQRNEMALNYIKGLKRRTPEIEEIERILVG